MKLAIVGGGPAGLSLARLLANTRRVEATVFEASDRVGGKSHTVVRGSSTIEMGTCYTTASHRIAHRWMDEVGISRRLLGEQVFDGADVIKYIKQGSGPSLPFQVLRYVRARARLLKQLDRSKPTRKSLEDAARPVSEWLAARNLGKMYRLMQRAVTGLGYGKLEKTPTVHALRWVDAELIISGVRKRLQMPVEGWSEFWNRLAQNLDVRIRTRVVSIERHQDGVTLLTDDGSHHTFDAVACAIPYDDFVRLVAEPSGQEREVDEAIEWGRYTTTLLVVENWFRDHPVEAWSDALQPAAEPGMLISARFEADEPELGGPLYVTGQYGGTYSGAELRELLAPEIRARGGLPGPFVDQTEWKYMATYKDQAIRDGLLSTMRSMQGENRTFYTGAAFSHEAVSNIVNFNARLAREIRRAAPRLKAKSEALRPHPSSPDVMTRLAAE